MKNLQKIVGIMAATQQGVIGKRNLLPWDYKEELEYFRHTTRNHNIIMGRKTYDSIPRNISFKIKPIVFSRTLQNSDDKVIFVKSLYEYFNVNNLFNKSKKTFMIGGAEIAHLFLKHGLISSFILTRIHCLYQGDTYLNLKYFKGWKETVLKSYPKYTIVRLTNLGTNFVPECRISESKHHEPLHDQVVSIKKI